MIARILFVITSCATLAFGQSISPLSITRLNPTSFQLSWYANTLRPYQIENSPDLVNWTELTGYIEGTNALQGVLVTKTTDKLFFRLKTGAIRSGFNSLTLFSNDDDSVLVADDPETPADESIGFSINVFPTEENPGPWTDCYVNNNGNLSIGVPAGSYRPLPLQSSAEEVGGLIALIAPFWADVDTRFPAPAFTAVTPKEVTYGQGHVDGRPAFGVNWQEVGYYTREGSATDKLNSFQLILIDRSNIGNEGDFDVEFNYNQILWETGDLSGGTNGYGGRVGRVGITNGVDRTIEGQYPGETLVQLDSIPSGFTGAGTRNYATGLIYRKRNSSVPGRLVFQFRNGNLVDALQVNAGPDLTPASSATTVFITGTASDPSGAAIATQWSVIQNTTPVTIENANQLSTTVTFEAGTKVSLQLTARRANDPTISASDVMVINP